MVERRGGIPVRENSLTSELAAPGAGIGGKETAR